MHLLALIAAVMTLSLSANINIPAVSLQSESDSVNAEFDRIYFDSGLMDGPHLPTYTFDSEALHFVGKAAKNGTEYHYIRYYTVSPDGGTTKWDNPHIALLGYYEMTDDTLTEVNGMDTIVSPGQTPTLRGVTATNKLGTKLGFVTLTSTKIKNYYRLLPSSSVYAPVSLPTNYKFDHNAIFSDTNKVSGVSSQFSEIFVAASYVKGDNSDSSFVLWKFNTRFNITEFARLGPTDVEDFSTPYERVTMVRYDAVNSQGKLGFTFQVIVGVEVKQDGYLGSTVSNIGAHPHSLPNINIALVAFDATYGNLKWTQLLGCSSLRDDLRGFVLKGSHAYVLTNCEGGGFALHHLNTYNGELLSSNQFYSNVGNKALGLSGSVDALYGYFYIPSSLVDSVGGNTYNVAAASNVLAEFSLADLSIISIGAQTGSNSEIDTLPVLLHPLLTTSLLKHFVIRHGSNGNRTALHFSSFSDNALLTNTGCSDSTNCAFCSALNTAHCGICNAGFFLYRGICGASAATFTTAYPVGTEMNACYYSCDTCTGPARNQCSSCKAGSSLTLSSSTCVCAANYENSDSASMCDSDCPMQFGARYKSQCVSTCPDNTYADYSFSTGGVFAPPASITQDPGGCVAMESVTSQPLLLDSPIISSFPSLFTMSLWLKVSAKEANAVYVSAYEVVSLHEGPSGGVKYSYKQNSGITTGSIMGSTLASDVWSFFSISKKNGPSNIIFQTSYCSPCSTTLNAGSSLSGVIDGPVTHKNRIIIGAEQVSSSISTFTGLVQEVRIFTSFHPRAFVQNYFKARTPPGLADLLAYWRFNEDPADSDLLVYDSSPNQKISNIIATGNAKVSCTTPLTSAQRYQAQCKGFVQFSSSTGIMTVSHLKRFSLSAQTWENAEYLHLYPESPFAVTTQDRLNIETDHDRCRGKTPPILQYKWTGTTLAPVTASTFSTVLTGGNYFTLCVDVDAGEGHGESKLYIGQIYLGKTPTLILPNNQYTEEGMNTRIYFYLHGGDRTYYEKIFFHENCLISATSPPADTTALIRSETTGQIERKNIDDFRISGKKVYQCYSPSYAPDEFTRIGAFFWIFSKTPLIFGSASVKYNAEFFDFSLVGNTLQDFDRVGFMIRTGSATTCQSNLLLPAAEFGVVRTFNQFPMVWFGKQSGMYFTETSSVTILACYRAGTLNMAPPWWTLNTSGQGFLLTVTGAGTNDGLTEILSITPAPGAVVTDTSTRVTFTMKGNVKPSKGNSHNGYVKIIRAALTSSGKFTVSTTPSDVVWSETFTSNAASWSVGDLQGIVDSGNTVFTLTSATDYLTEESGYYFCTVAHSFKDSTTGSRFMEPNTSTAQVCPYFFYVSDIRVTPSDDAIPTTVNSLEIEGSHLLTSSSGTFTTSRVQVQFRVEDDAGVNVCGNDVLKYPSAYIDLIQDTKVSSTSSFDMGICNTGNLLANITFVRDNGGSYEHSITLLNIKIGTIGCHSSCFSCKGRTDSDCFMCPSGTLYNTDGMCNSTCIDPAKPYYRQISDPNAPTAPRTYECLAACPSQYKLDSRTNECMSCSQTCDECISFVPNSCIDCQPGNFYFEASCIPNCPTPVYVNNFQNYTCQMNSTLNQTIGVSILPLIYETRQAKNKQYYFEAMITGNRSEPLTSVEWAQILPEYDTSITSNYIIEPTSSTNLMAKANMNTFNSYSESQTYVVKVTVTDAGGNKGTAVKQFFMNEPPKTSSLVVFPATSIVPLNAGTSEYFEFELQDWYNEIDDPQFQLSVAVYYKLINKNVYYMIRPYNVTKSFKFEMPYVYFDQKIPLTGGGSSDTFNMQIFVTALDNHGARTTQTARVDVKNSYTFSQLDSTLTTLSYKNLSFVGNLLFVLNSCEAILQKATTTSQKSSSLSRRASFVHMPCSSSFHCRNGICNLQYGFCECYNPYVGHNCDWQQSSLTHINNFALAGASYLNSTYNITAMKQQDPGSYVNSRDIEFIFTVIKHALKVPEAISEEVLYFFIDFIVEIVKDGDTQLTSTTAGQLLTQDLQRITESISRAMEVLLVLSRGCRIELAKANQSGDSAAITLAQTALDAKNLEYSSKIQQLEYALKICLKVFPRTLTKEEPTLRYTTNLFSYQLTKALPQDLYGSRSLIFDGVVASYYVHSRLFTSNPELPDQTTFIIEQMLHWVNNPKQLTQSSYLVETSVSEYTLRNPDSTEIDISKSQVPIDILLPFAEIPNPHDQLRLECNWFNTTAVAWSTEGCVTLDVSSSGVHCRCNHLSQFAGLINTGINSLAQLFVKGVYTDYNGFLYWYRCLAFYVISIVIGIYIVLFPCALFCERKKLRKLRKSIQHELDQLKHPTQGNKDKDYRSVAMLEMQRFGMRDENQTIGKKKVPGGGTFDLDNQLTERKMDKFKKKNKLTDLPPAPSELSGYLVEESVRKGRETPRLVPNVQKQQKRNPPPSSMDQTIDKSSLDLSIASHHNLNRSRDQETAFGALRQKEVSLTKSKRKSKQLEFIDKITPSRQILSASPIGKEELELGGYDDGTGAMDAIDTVNLQKERKRFMFWEQLKGASPILNTLFVTNLMLPRHVRLTMFFSQIVMNMFGCAVYYNNIESALQIPEENPSLHVMTAKSVGISFLAPLFTDLAVYFVAGLFRISEGRFRNVETSDDYQSMLNELRKETLLRYIMAYFVLSAGTSAMLWYIIRISSMFGWRVSSAWLWSSLLSWVMDFVGYEIIFAILFILIYKCNRRFGVFLDKVRKFRQAVSEE